MFPYTFMRGGQARPCQTRQRLTYPLQFPYVNFSSHLCILVISFKCRWSRSAPVGFELEPLTLWHRRLRMHKQGRRVPQAVSFASCERVYQSFKIILIIVFELMYVFLKKWNFFLKQLTEKKNNRFTKPRRRIVLLQVFWQRTHTLGFLWNWNEDLRYSHESQFCFEFQCSKVCCSNCYLRFKVQMIILHIRSRSYCLLFFGFVCNTNPFSNNWYKAYFYIILK